MPTDSSEIELKPLQSFAASGENTANAPRVAVVANGSVAYSFGEGLAWRGHTVDAYSDEPRTTERLGELAVCLANAGYNAVVVDTGPQARDQLIRMLNGILPLVAYESDRSRWPNTAPTTRFYDRSLLAVELTAMVHEVIDAAAQAPAPER